MNEKMKGKTYVKIPKVAHRQLKFLALKRDVKLEDVVAEAIWKFLKSTR